MLKFTDFITLYEAYTSIYGAQTQPVAQPVTQPVTQSVAQPVTQSVAQPVAQPTSADLLSAINALRVPSVQGSVPKAETIDDIVCRLGGIKVPQEGEKK